MRLRITTHGKEAACVQQAPPLHVGQLARGSQERDSGVCSVTALTGTEGEGLDISFSPYDGLTKTRPQCSSLARSKETKRDQEQKASCRRHHTHTP